MLLKAFIVCTAFACLVKANASDSTGPPRCQSRIFCTGDVLHTIQMAKIFNDSKTFVDMKLKQPPNRTIELFEDFMTKHDGSPSREDIRQFVASNFDKRGTEFGDWTPTDWKESPAFLQNIKDPNFRKFGADLHVLWKVLGRKMHENITDNSELYSIIYVKNGVIVPGGRFLEFYYWDSYWIMRGLLYSEMHETVKGMLRNFLSIIDRFGFIPNGGRIYYLTRSQPPMLPSMVESYVEMTNDTNFIREALPRLQREFDFYENNHMVKVGGYYLAIYGYDGTGRPRPESYVEDVMSASHFKTPEERGNFYSEMVAGAESGMDFSSRWFIKNKTNDGQLIDIKARSIIPVELNALLQKNAQIIANFHEKLGNTNIAVKYKYKAKQLYDAIQAILWNESHGTWFDYDLINQQPRLYFAPTNLSPLWTGSYDKNNKSNIARKVLAYIDSVGIDSFPGGVPNSLVQSGEQWDYPNVWPPMQYLLCEGLRTLDDKNATDLANKWTTRWTRSNYIAYNETEAMFEKYSAEELGGHGGGGEYEVQTGFGWSNGVIVEFLAKYGQNLTSTD